MTAREASARIVLVVCVSLLVALATLHDAMGQETGVIAGRVTNEDGDGIEGIWVIMGDHPVDDGPQEAGLTGADGRYEITAPAGQYRVHFRDSMDSDRPVLYEETCYQHAPCDSPDLVMVPAGQRVDNVDEQMQAVTPTISGHVYNAVGKPVPGIIVGSLPDYDPDSRVCGWPPHTNSHGRFIVRLPGAGDYTISFVDGEGCGYDTGLPSVLWTYSSEQYRDKNEAWRGKENETPDVVHAESDSIIDGIDAVLEKCGKATYGSEPSMGWVECPGTASGSSKPAAKRSSTGKGSASPSPSKAASSTPTSEPSNGSTPAARAAAALRETGSSALVASLSALSVGVVVAAALVVRRRRRAPP